MYNKDEIVYPVFLKCCNLCENNFWRNIFIDLSKSLTPYGTYISKDYFCCSYKNKEFSYKIDESLEPEVIFNDVTSLLKNKLKLRSLNEKIHQLENLRNNNKNDKLNWNSIRKKSSRKLLIEKFIIEKSKQYNLKLKQQKNLLNLIYYFILIKSINYKDIIFEGKKIVEIPGIKFSNKTIEIEEHLKKIFVSENSNKIQNNIMKSNWDKYLRDIHKLCHSLE